MKGSREIPKAKCYQLPAKSVKKKKIDVRARCTEFLTTHRAVGPIFKTIPGADFLEPSDILVLHRRHRCAQAVDGEESDSVFGSHATRPRD